MFSLYFHISELKYFRFLFWFCNLSPTDCGLLTFDMRLTVDSFEGHVNCICWRRFIWESLKNDVRVHWKASNRQLHHALQLSASINQFPLPSIISQGVFVLFPNWALLAPCTFIPLQWLPSWLLLPLLLPHQYISIDLRCFSFTFSFQFAFSSFLLYKKNFIAVF